MKHNLPILLCVFATALLAAGIMLADSPSGRPDFSPVPPVYHPSPPAFSIYPPNCPKIPPTQFGDPLPGLTPGQLALFVTGSNQFTHLDTPDDGLGPIFNSPSFPTSCDPVVSCASCHGFPATGGLVAFSETRFGLITPTGFDPLANLGGSLLEVCAIPGCTQETNPVVGLPNGVTALRQIIPVFGDGLIEAIPDGTIILNALRSRGDGVSGRPALLRDIGSTNSIGNNPIRVGRFGWKAQLASLRAFSGDAYNNEMGVTNPLFPEENYANSPSALCVPCDPFPTNNPCLLDDAPDATGKADIDRFTDFMRLLGPPPALPLTNYSTIRGSMLFTQIGCARCHTPVLFTGPNTNFALAFKPARLFSDLVLHDMGSLNDNIAQAAARTNQMRTPPLWGVRVRGELGLGRLNHDGLSTNMVQAISRHDGEGANARKRFLMLPAGDQQDVIKFLNTL